MKNLTREIHWVNVRKPISMYFYTKLNREVDDQTWYQSKAIIREKVLYQFRDLIYYYIKYLT